ncbi:MAG: LytTR family transcriptional regulator [Ruminococcaceae bacterium]|nr:LytTR family transcriptional regulator [Oscillospiraceae bacterium]
MKIEIIQNEGCKETEITIKAKYIDEELSEILACLSLIGNTVAGVKEGVVSFIPLRDIYYFESVDNKTFIYTKDDVYEIKSRLYELEEKLSNTSFVRISKSTIANLKKLRSIKRAKGSRLEAELVSGEKLIVSRQYVNEIKNKLGV